jgi:hypothetical protein
MPTEPGSDRRRDPAAERTISPAVTRWVVGVATFLVIWFFFAWLILDRHVLDAAGESVGTAFALGVVVSLIGALRGSR